MPLIIPITAEATIMAIIILLTFLVAPFFNNKTSIPTIAINILSIVAFLGSDAWKRSTGSTPYNVDVMGDLLDELENNGVFF